MMGEMNLGLKDKEFLLLIMDSFAAGLCTFEAEINRQYSRDTRFFKSPLSFYS
jgi:hypothetical protein